MLAAAKIGRMGFQAMPTDACESEGSVRLQGCSGEGRAKREPPEILPTYRALSGSRHGEEIYLCLRSAAASERPSPQSSTHTPRLNSGDAIFSLTPRGPHHQDGRDNTPILRLELTGRPFWTFGKDPMRTSP